MQTRWLWGIGMSICAAPLHAGPVPSSWDVYLNESQGYTIRYSTMTRLIRDDGWAVFEHSIPYTHTDPCTGQSSSRSVDFHAAFRLDARPLSAIIQSESPPAFSKKYLRAGSLVLEFGLVDPYEAGPYRGYQITAGQSACGRCRYYFALPDGRTLIAERPHVPDRWEADPEAVNPGRPPGSMTVEESTRIFQTMLSSVEPTGSHSWKDNPVNP